AFVGDGCAIYEQTRVTDFEGGDPCRAVTSQGVVRARHLFLATHTPLGRSPLHAAVVPMRSYVAAFRVRGKAPHGLFWDTAEPYHYLRSQATSDGTYVLVG